MSIRHRIEDALFLWENGRLEGAFLSVLVAVAASSKRRFPKEKDRISFERFLEESVTVKLSVDFRGQLHTVEHILYKWLRCELLHEGQIPIDVQFMPDTELNSRTVRAGGFPEYVLKLSVGWFYYLLSIVINAPENKDEFKNFICQTKNNAKGAN